MNVTVCQCRKCGKYHVFEEIGVRDVHVCECGEKIERWTHRMEKCEIEKGPNEPLGAWKTATALKPGFQFRRSDDDIEAVCPKKLFKKVTIDVEVGKGFNNLLKNVEELEERFSNIPGLVMIDSNGKANVIPIISTDSKMIVFKTITPHSKERREELEKEYTDKLGVKCVVMNYETELVAVIDG